jgi:DNA-binding CsgD family transcriptional regulator
MKTHTATHIQNDKHATEIVLIDWKHKKIHNQSKYFLGCHYPNHYLTQREAEVLTLIPNRTYQEIAEILKLSRRTIEVYAHRLIIKLHCSTKRELNILIKQYNFISQLQNLIEFD